MAISSSEFQEMINGRVADRVDDSYRQRTSSEVRPCDECRTGFEKELSQKVQVRKRSLVKGAPTESSLLLKSGAGGGSERIYSDRSSRQTNRLPFFILGGVIIALLALVYVLNDGSGESVQETTVQATGNRKVNIPEPTRRSTGPSNFFNYAMENYTNLVQDKLNVATEAGSLAELQSTFSEAGIPPLEFTGVNLPLKGGIVGDNKGTKVPHIIYADDRTKVYVVELPVAVLTERKGFYVTEDVLAQLEAGEQIWMEAPMRGNLVMYKKNDHVIIGAANRTKIDTQKLLGLPRK